jgi:hypothetical protein
MMEYTDRLEWMPEDFDRYSDFYKLFGFNEYEIPGDINRNVYLGLEQQFPIDIKGYDTFVHFSINMPGNDTTEKICDIVKPGGKYTLNKHTTKEQCDLFLSGEDNKELIRFSTKEIFDKFYSYSTGKGSMTPEEATFSKENGAAKITIIVQNININKSPDQVFYGADLYTLVMIK